MTRLSQLATLIFFIFEPNHSRSSVAVGFFDWLHSAFTLIFSDQDDRHHAQHTPISHFHSWATLSFPPYLSSFDDDRLLATLGTGIAAILRNFPNSKCSSIYIVGIAGKIIRNRRTCDCCTPRVWSSRNKSRKPLYLNVLIILVIVNRHIAVVNCFNLLGRLVLIQQSC